MGTVRIQPGGSATARVWQPLELSLTASGSYDNPYTEVEFYIDLQGPGFSKRVYGFWNGGQEFAVRLCAPAPGTWYYATSSNVRDSGLDGVTGSIEVDCWDRAALEENPNRRGMVGLSADRRGLEYADGTPFFLIADTWWSVPSYRFPLPEGETRHPLGPNADLRDYVEHRKAQGFNSVAMIAALPNWADDGHASTLYEDDGTVVRKAWKTPDGAAMNMHNEGGRPFEFPGRAPGLEQVVPDFDRINPEFFKVLDKKMDLLFDAGIVPFLEAARRDTGQTWRKYHDWPESYARYVQYVFARYQAHNAIFSPIHFDSPELTIPSRDYNAPCNLVIDRYGRPPFGTLLSANASPSTLVDFGGPDECRWLDMHQIGNVREHFSYWWLTEQYHAEPARPALNGEPYYSGLHALSEPYRHGKPGDTPEDDMYVRSGMYGSLLSGGYAGYIYGCEGIWQSSIEQRSETLMYDAFGWSSAETVRHLKTFAFVRGTRYRTLVPDAELLVPNKRGGPIAYEGWAYCARSEERDWFLIYFEANCSGETWLRGVDRQHTRYLPSWFDPRKGEWLAPGEPVEVQRNGMVLLPALPDASLDWGLQLERIGRSAA